MATYAELLQLADNERLRNQVRVAVWIACNTIRTEPSTTPNNANRLRWAREALRDPLYASIQLMPVVLAQNSAATPEAILAATDAQVQGAVDAAINVVAG